MKKILLFAAVAMLFAACTKDATKDLAIERAESGKFYVTIGDEDSRVQLNEVCQTVWTEGDRVSVFNKTTGNRRYKFTGKTGDRTGELSYMNGGTTGEAIDKIIAVYPYNSANTVFADGTVMTIIPQTQTYCENSYGVGSSLMVAYSSTERLTFRNMVGWIRIALTGNAIVKNIILFGNNQEKIAGDVTLDNNFSMTLGSNATTIITLDCESGVQLSPTKAKYFYIALLPQTLEKGISVIITDKNNNTMPLKTADPITVNRNHIVAMAQSEYKGQLAPPCNQIHYNTSDDEIIAISNEAFNSNIISNTYSNGKGVITFDSPLVSIGNSAFKGIVNLTRITIPNSITTIGESSFEDCRGLTSVTIPGSVTTIGNNAFYNCKRLSKVLITDIAAWCNIKFESELCNPLYNTKSNLYLNGILIRNLIIPTGVTAIGDYAFYNCEGLTSVTIPDSITTIGKSAFYGCKGLTNATIGNGVATIGDNAFNRCTGLTSIAIGNGIKAIGKEAFSYCEGLNGVYITDIAAWCNIKFGSNPLSYANNLYLNEELVTDLVIPNGVTAIGRSAFNSCTSLASITILDSVTEIGDYSFGHCKTLANVTISGSIKKIGEGAFKGCEGLTNVTIPNSVTEIGRSAFSDCIYSLITNHNLL